jgi:outer membrane protein assembly factor BamB
VDGAHDNLAPERRQRFLVLALDARTGRTLWERAVSDEVPHEATHTTGSWASASPVTDGEVLIASFGSRGIFALDLDGSPLWQVDLGDMQIRHAHGEGSSPALHGDTVVVSWDHQGDSFVVALNRRTGEQRWRRSRDEITSWSSPRIVEHEGKAQVILAATKRVRSYDLETGETLWEVGGLSRNVVATPVATEGLAFVANSYDWRAMLAIRLSARGDLTGTPAVVWTRDRDTPYVPSPALADGMLCFIKHLQNVLTCVEAATGKVRFGPRRLPGVQGVFASPVIADGRIYVPGRNGVTSVVDLSEPYGTLATNRLDDSFSASPAVVDRAIFLRGEASLYRIEEPAARP